jgi:uncharacterized oxidoreductase
MDNHRMTGHFIATATLHRWTMDLWVAAGSSPREAELTADHLVGANLAGHDSHGVGMVPRYVNAWLAGELRLNEHVAVAQDAGNLLTLDGRRGMGQVVAHEAMELAIDRARAQGVCVLGLRDAHHIGRIGHWAEQATDAGLVSVHFVNGVSRPYVAPHGGRHGRFNTNPFTVGIPVPGREPIVLDFATSAIAQGKARVAFNKGIKVAPGLLLDADGEPADDPAVMFPPHGGRPGALLPMGGHKGYALAMVCEVLGAALTGGDTGRDANLTMQHAIVNNMLALVFDPARMAGAPMFGAEVAAFVEWVQSSPLRPGTDAILMPGDPERASRAARAARIPVDGGTLAALDDAAAKVRQARGAELSAPSSLVQRDG